MPVSSTILFPGSEVAYSVELTGADISTSSAAVLTARVVAWITTTPDLSFAATRTLRGPVSFGHHKATGATYSNCDAASWLSVARFSFGFGRGRVAVRAGWTGAHVRTHSVGDSHGHGAFTPRVVLQGAERRAPTVAFEIVHGLMAY